MTINESKIEVKPPISTARIGRILIFLIFAAMLVSCGGKSVATVGNESEAIEIIDVLRENEIPSNKEEVIENNVTRYRIVVGGSDPFGDDNYAMANQVLRDYCLPLRDPAPVDGGGYIASLEAERARIQRQTKIGIIGQLRKLRSVTCVDVNFVMPQGELESRNPYPSSATVLVIYKDQEPGFTEQEIKRQVAGSVAKLSPDNVDVKMSYQPVRPIVKSNRGSLNRIFLIGGAGFVIILGSVFLVYFMRRKASASTALAVRAEDEDEDDEN